MPARDVDGGHPVPEDAIQIVVRVKSKIEAVRIHIVKVEEQLCARQGENLGNPGRLVVTAPWWVDQARSSMRCWPACGAS